VESQAMPERLRPIVRRVAMHEAGHYVVGRTHGFEVGDCTATILDMNGGHRGGSETKLARTLESLEQVGIYLQQRVQVLYAGALAESLSQLGEVDNNVALNCIHKGGAQDDHSKARELIHLIRNLMYPRDSSREEMQAHLDEIDSTAWNAAAACVEAEHTVIQGVAGFLADALMRVKLRVEARITAAQINALPGIIARFGSLPEGD
jgi:hypothetical protein